MEIIVSIPDWYSRRGLEMHKPDKRMLVLFLVSEQQMSAIEAIRWIDQHEIQHGSAGWEAWVGSIRSKAAQEAYALPQGVEFSPLANDRGKKSRPPRTRIQRATPEKDGRAAE